MVRAALRQPTASAVAACVGGCPLTHAYRTTDPNNGACPTCSDFLGSGHEYSFDRLAKLLDFDQEGVRGAFRALYDTDSDVAASYGTFSGLVDDLVRRYNESSGSTMDDAYQNARAASVYLFFRYPERYHYYKPTVADSLCAAVGSVLPSDPAERFVAYEALCDAMMPAVLSDKDLVALSDSVLDGRQLAAVGSRADVTQSGMWEGPATVCEACPQGDRRGSELVRVGVTGRRSSLGGAEKKKEQGNLALLHPYSQCEPVSTNTEFDASQFGAPSGSRTRLLTLKGLRPNR